MDRATIDQSYPSSALQEAVLATIDKLNSCGLKAKPGKQLMQKIYKKFQRKVMIF